MSEELDRSMSPLADSSQLVTEELAKILKTFLPYIPISPYKKEMEHFIKMSKLDEKDRKKFDNSGEQDISMSTNIPRAMALVVGYAKALEVTNPCEARMAFMEQVLRACRSEKGWIVDKTIEGLKAVRPLGEQEKERGRIGRFLDWFKNR